MRLNSTSLGIMILIIFFGGILTASALGMWQTQGGGIKTATTAKTANPFPS